jgi:hypothetical protein
MAYRPAPLFMDAGNMVAEIDPNYQQMTPHHLVEKISLNKK